MIGKSGRLDDKRSLIPSIQTSTLPLQLKVTDDEANEDEA